MRRSLKCRLFGSAGAGADYGTKNGAIIGVISTRCRRQALRGQDLLGQARPMDRR